LSSSKLNEDQCQALLKVLAADNFVGIQGMPGTGKTFLIVQLINILIEQNLKILISSYTHQALNNILL